MDLIGGSALRGWSVASLVANATLVVTGGLVRVTGSGLGCSTWPECQPGSYLPHAEADIHSLIEFGNRLLTFVLVAVAVGTFIAAWRFRNAEGNPDRGIRGLALTAALGIPAQAVIGGLSVLSNLNPWVVGLHMLASAAIIVVCVALIHRSFALAPITIPGSTQLLNRVVFGLSLVVVVLGTVVTGAGPNSGDGGSARSGLSLEWTAKIHAWAVWLLLAGLLWLALRTWGNQRARKAIGLVLGISVLQGLIGYLQYFLGNPPALVAFHMAGVALFTAAASHLFLATRTQA